jgi:RNA polymerase sigma-70 factor (ECF subfamily)
LGRSLQVVDTQSDEQVLQRIHARLLAGDTTAFEELAEFYLGVLERRLRAKWPGVPADAYWDAITNTLFDYAEHPQRYDPQRAPLHAYLFMSATRDLQNVLERDWRRRRRAPVSLDAVEDRGDGRNDPLSQRLADERASPDHWLDEPDPVLLAAVAAALPDARDRAVLELMSEGERRTAAFAELLGAADLPPDEQRKVVKRAKDRIQKRVQRAIARRSDG